MGLLKHLLGRGKRSGPACTAIVPAAGHSSRMGEDKLLLPLGDVPVILWTLRALEGCDYIAEIILVTREDLIVPLGQLCKDAALEKVSKIVIGGESRMESVLSGVREADPASELIAIHDGARPLVSLGILNETIETAIHCGAAAPAVPVKDTVKRAVNGVVESTLNREELYAVQTPQVFEHGLILGALEKAKGEGVVLTDDCAAVERLGIPVHLTAGSYDNIKLTTPEDMAMATAILERWGLL